MELRTVREMVKIKHKSLEYVICCASLGLSVPRITEVFTPAFLKT